MDLHPSVKRPRARGFLYALLSGSLVAGAFLLFDRDEPPAPITRVEVAPTAPAPAPIIVPIHVPPPPAPAPVVAPAPEPEPEKPQPRVLTPLLNPNCVDIYGDGDGSDGNVACNWHDGFPAITRDGKTMVAKRIEDDGGRGYPNLHIDFIDTATLKVTRSIKILDADEYDPETEKHAPKILRRVKAAQRAIDAGDYRSLTPLVSVDSGEPSWTHLRTESSEGSIRIIDPERGITIWRAHYSGAEAFPNMKVDIETDMCGLPRANSVEAWVDAVDADAMSIVITHVRFSTGGCMCDDLGKMYVSRIR